MRICSLGVFVLFMIEYSQGVAFPAAIKTKYETYLKEFDNKRGHVPFSPDLDANRHKITMFMKSKFEAAGLHVSLQNFSSMDTSTGKPANGTNVIAILRGTTYSTPQDEAIIIAAHIDTFGRDAGGVNNDGSGLVGLLAIAEDLTGPANCTRNKTVVFAAFDRSETENIGPSLTYCNKSCGSIHFIKNIASFISSGKIKLAMVLDCLANFDDKISTQYWPPVLGKYFRNTVEENTMVDAYGDFLAVTGRNNEKSYIEEFAKIYDASKVDGAFQITKLQWNIQGIPNAGNRSNLIAAFKDGDHISFWDSNINAILLTDTCYNRDWMKGNCKTTSSCDTMDKIDDKGYSFMYNALYTATKLITKNTCTGACSSCDVKAVCKGNVCVCQPGFTGNGNSCTDINECEKTPCNKHADCSNWMGSYTCICKKGYSGNGHQCTAITTASVVQILPQVLILTVSMLLSYFWM